MNLTPTEQHIYNCHLKHFRNGAPWKARKNFNDLDDSTVFFLKKIQAFFQKFPHINWDDFFSAPKKMHPDEPTPNLKFFTTRAAIKCYNNYLKQLLDQSPDQQLDKIKKGFEFIVKFCINENIFLENYIFHKNGIMPSWAEHYRTHQISPYCLMEFEINFNEFSEDEAALWIPNLSNNFSAFKQRYHNSLEAKKIVKKIIPQIQKLIKDKLTLSANLISSNNQP